jgi:hypothetical protein
VEISIVEDGRGRVGLLDPADDLAVERLLERLGGRHQRVGVGVLGVEVGDDLGVGPVLQPVVVVDASPPEELEPLRDHLRLRREQSVVCPLTGNGERGQQAAGQDC